MTGTLTFRIGAILLGGFLLLQLALLVALMLPGPASDNGSHGLPPPPAFAEMIDAVERAGPAGADRLVRSYDGSLFTVEIRATPPAEFREVPDSMAALARAYRNAVSDHNIVVDGGPGRRRRLLANSVRPMRFMVPIRLTVWLRDGRVLVLTGRPSTALRHYLLRRSMLAFGGGLVLLLVLGLALRQTTRPLRRLTRHVHALGEYLNAPDAPVEGSREVRALGTAFNAMKGRITRLVEERTFILAGIAHDMRTYLTRLQLRADFIADPDQRRRAMTDLEQMGTLLDDSLLFASAGRRPLSIERLDLSRLTRDLAEGHIDAERITLDLPEGVEVEGEEAALRRVFGNLADNGLRHGERLHISAMPEGDHIAWIFEDDGPGVPDGQMAALGQAFARGDTSRDRRTGGAGLGLAIVQALTEAMGGKVRYGGATTGGLRVTILLPVSPQNH